VYAVAVDVGAAMVVQRRWNLHYHIHWAPGAHHAIVQGRLQSAGHRWVGDSWNPTQYRDAAASGHVALQGISREEAADARGETAGECG
jgi:hypothetical protein